VSESTVPDYYEALQINPSAEQETIARVYRYLAQRFHPDNQDTGNDQRFREVSDAYKVLSDPEARARYDLAYHKQRQDRLRLVESAEDPDNDVAAERRVRLTVLEALYMRRRLEPLRPGIFILELEQLIGRPREHLEFTVWFLLEKNLIQRGDNSTYVITADGAEYLEEHGALLTRQRLLRETNAAT
jgi:curved DNA-binding protein CbpA